jgi:deoxyribonuclease V
VHVQHLHGWDLAPREAMRLQAELAGRIVRSGNLPEGAVRRIAGADVAFDKPHGRAAAAVVVLAYPSLEIVERVTYEAAVTFPYVPGLLSFRETPAVLGAFERVIETPDVLMVDGHGYAHPRRFGYACHLGLLLDLPAVGVAKSRLTGSHDAVGNARGARADLLDGDEVIGSLLRTRERMRPLYVSVGHRLSLSASEHWVLACARGYRMPEPTRVADRLSREAKRRMLDLTLEMVVEQRAGEPGRWEWGPENERIVFRHDLDPMPTHYGCSVDLVNPADGELLDIMLVDDVEHGRGERLHVRVVDVLERDDGDHKLLAVPAGVEPCADTTLCRLDVAREASWRWYVAHGKPVVRWGREDGALAVIEGCRPQDTVGGVAQPSPGGPAAR